MKKSSNITAITLLLIQLSSILLYYKKLPNRMIIHENIMGQPDNYGSKTLLFVIFAISFLLFIMFQIIRKYPEKFNYPFFNEKYKELIYVKSQNLIDYLKIITATHY